MSVMQATQYAVPVGVTNHWLRNPILDSGQTKIYGFRTEMNLRSLCLQAELEILLKIFYYRVKPKTEGVEGSKENKTCPRA